MGKKTRTRRTKWRRLSLGEASGPEEEDDEIQQHLEQEDLSSAQQSSDVVVLHSDELSGDEQFAQDSPVVVLTQVADGTSNSSNKTSSQEEEAQAEMMVSNPHQQQNNQPQQRGPTWKLPANQQPAKPGGGYYNANNGYNPSNGASRPVGNATNSNNGGQFRRGGNNGPRYNGSFNSGYGGNGSYGRANSWNSSAASSYNGDHHHHHHHHQPGGMSKMHGIEKKIFNDEEYTKISTPRQEVLFKKGSIGAKKRVTPAASAGAGASNADSGSEQDSVNGNAASPVSPAQGDADSFQYSGNDSGSTGDASSTAGEAQSPDVAASAIAAASGAGLQQGYDGSPLVCFPMYDFYGGYGGMYPGSMLVQTYPGGPIVAAVPVPVPVQTIDWYRGAAAGAGGGAAANGANATGDVSYYYALGYPAGSEITGQPETSSSSRRNSLESYQASSQEVMTGSEASSSENSSPCSTGPSSQGPASPQGELVSPAIDPKAQTGGGVATAAAAAAVVMDMTMDNNRKMAGAGFVYPYAAAYCLAPPALYASGSVCDPNSYYYDDCGDVVYYEQYDEEAMDVNADAPDEMLEPLDGPMDGQWKVVTLEEEGAAAAATTTTTTTTQQEFVVGSDLAGTVPDRGAMTTSTSSTTSTTTSTTAQVNPNVPTGSGRRKKRRKKRNKTRLERASQPRVTDDGAGDGEEDEEEEAATDEKELEAVTMVVREAEEKIPSASSILADAAPAHVLSSDDPLLGKVDDPHHSSLEPSAPLSSTPLSSTTPELLVFTSNAPSVDDGDQVAATESSSPVAVLECRGAILPPLLCQEKSEHCISLPESSALPDPPETLEPPAFCSTPSFPLESSTSISSLQLPCPSTGLFVIPIVEEQQDDDGDERFQSSRQQQQQELPEHDPAILFESSNPGAESAQFDIQIAQMPIASELLVHEYPGDLPSVNKDHPDLPSSSSSSSGGSGDSIEEDSLMGKNPKAAEGIDRDSLDGTEEVDEDDDGEASSSDDFVYLQLDERDEAPDGYFDDEPNGIVGSNDPSLMHLTPQLWRTVILEESEPNSKEMSPLLCSDSGIVAGTPSPPVSSVDSTTGAEADTIGPITKAVSRWLESAPIQQQLIASSTVLGNDETDDEDVGDCDDDYQEDEVMQEMLSVPKNELATLLIAPSSDVTVMDGPLRRVDPSEKAIVQDLPLSPTEEEPPVQPLSQHCDPAKFSVYYQLGVSVDVDGDGQVKSEVEEIEGGDSILEDSATAALIQPTLDDSIRQCPLTTDSTMPPAQVADIKKRRKRNAWRRVLLLHRAVHNRSDGDANAPTADNLKTRRLKSGPSCCALQ